MRDVQSKLVVLLLAFGPAILLALVAVVPGLNFLFSGHGGPAWFVLPLAFPFALLILCLAYRGSPKMEKPAAKKFVLVSVACYIPLSLLASIAGAYSIRASFGLDVSPWHLWAVFLSPFGLPAVWLWSAL